MLRYKLIFVLFLILSLISCKNDEKDIINDNYPAWVDTEPISEKEILESYINVQEVKYIVIHCDATTIRNNWNKEDILRFFKEERKWSRPGYTFWIKRDGTIHTLMDNKLDCLVDYSEISNGAKGFNFESIHIAYAGGADLTGASKDTRTVSQKKALSNLISLLLTSCPNATVLGHRDLTGVTKSCPSFDVSKEGYYKQ